MALRGVIFSVSFTLLTLFLHHEVPFAVGTLYSF